MPRLRVYISADYDPNSGDRNVVDLLNKWGDDAYHKVDFVDTAKVKSGSVSKETDCRICDLKDEFNRQIKASSYVIFVIGDKTASRTAGSSCDREDKEWIWCECTPYGENVAGRKTCKKRMREVYIDDVDCVNSYSYIKHEFEEAVMREKSIIILNPHSIAVSLLSF